ncbi:hypothetical protein [Metabacillus halosaccharovorans]|uniref:hypothetical protein n=1 Tax=Metabacillus halosaccharovorans TaxID=930124 RepID=UPI0009950411|nr:hypothetical protein [Metabacillus halosaccharovorans]
MSSNLVGRPRGKKKTAKIEITIEPEIKEAFMKSLHENNQYASIVLREWIIDYINGHGVGKK